MVGSLVTRGMGQYDFGRFAEVHWFDLMSEGTLVDYARVAPREGDGLENLTERTGLEGHNSLTLTFCLLCSGWGWPGDDTSSRCRWCRQWFGVPELGQVLIVVGLGSPLRRLE
jgi:hypothetical protein